MNPVIIGGEPRYLGCLPREVRVGSICPTFESRMPLIPRNQWQDTDWSHLAKVVLNQGEQSSCAGASAVATLMALRAAAGLPHIELSIGSIYGLINFGRDRGALMSDSIRAVINTGACPVNVIPHFTWQPSRWPANYREIARAYRGLEHYDSPTFDQIATAIQRGFIVSYGVLIGNNFDPDRNGLIPARRGSRGGHAMTGVGLKKFGNTFFVKTVNSWSEKWGINGFAYVPESYFRGSFVDAWALRCVVGDPSFN